MENKKRLTFWKIVLLIFLVLLIGAGTFGTLCGGFFTIMFMFEGSGGYGFEYISIGSLVIGLLLLIAGFFGFKKFIESFKGEKISTGKALLLTLSSILVIGGIITSLWFLLILISQFSYINSGGFFIFFIVFVLSILTSYGGYKWFRKLMNIENKEKTSLKELSKKIEY